MKEMLLHSVPQSFSSGRLNWLPLLTGHLSSSTISSGKFIFHTEAFYQQKDPLPEFISAPLNGLFLELTSLFHIIYQNHCLTE